MVEDQSKAEGERYTLKKYHSRKVHSPDGTWSHDEILLLSLNPSHPSVRLESDGTYRICGWFVATVSKIQRIEEPQHRYVGDE